MWRGNFQLGMATGNWSERDQCIWCDGSLTWMLPFYKNGSPVDILDVNLCRYHNQDPYRSQYPIHSTCYYCEILDEVDLAMAHHQDSISSYSYPHWTNEPFSKIPTDRHNVPLGPKSDPLFPRFIGPYNSRPGLLTRSEFQSPYLNRKITLTDTNQERELKQMEIEKLHLTNGVNELLMIISQKEMENDKLRSLVHRLDNDKLTMTAQFERLKLHNEDICMEYKRQQSHLRDLYHTLNLYGFDYVTLGDGTKIATFHDPTAKLLSLEHKTSWSMYNQPVRHMSTDQETARKGNIGGAVSGGIGTARSHDQLMRRLADLQQERDHIDGYIQWLRQEAGKKEHIYDDPFSGDLAKSDDEFYSMEHTGHHGHKSDIATNCKAINTDNNPRKYATSGHPPNPNVISIDRTGQMQRQSSLNTDQSTAAESQDRRFSLGAHLRARFFRKDSLLAMLLDSNVGSSKPRKSIFSGQHKPKHNAFVTGRVYSAQQTADFHSSPSTTRRIRTHIL